MKLELGKTYLARNGQRVSISAHGANGYSGDSPYGQRLTWSESGAISTCGESMWDLVSLADAGDSHEEATFSDVAPSTGIGMSPPPAEKPMILSDDPKLRKGMPICTGVIDYFPLALAEVARVSKGGNDQHNPGQPLHWDRTKSLDHADCISRHLIDRGSRDSDGQRHSAKLAWRALALLQTELENEQRAVVEAL